MTRIAILGAGPIGLEAALAAAGRGDDFTVFEAAPTVGGHVRRWGHVRTFTPWDMTVSPRMRAALPDAPTRQRTADRRRDRARAARAGRRAAGPARAHPLCDPRAGGRPRGAAQARGDRRTAPRAAAVSPARAGARRARGDRPRRRRARRDRDVRQPQPARRRRHRGRQRGRLRRPHRALPAGISTPSPPPGRGGRSCSPAPATARRPRHARWRSSRATRPARGSSGRCATRPRTGARWPTTRCPSAPR